MPTRINQYQTPTLAYYARQERKRFGEAARIEKTARVPLPGYVPDLAPHIAGLGGARECANCLMRPLAGRGDFLTNSAGYAKLDAAHAPFGGGRAGTGGGFFTYSDGTLRPVAIWAGNGAGTDITMEYLATTGLFTAIAKNVAAGGHVTTDPEGDRDVLWDMAAFQFGAPTRTYNDTVPAAHVTITTPLIIMCSGDDTGPVDPVLMYPGDGNDPTKYNELWETAFVAQTGAGAALQYPFRAVSVEPFQGRLVFLNTKEGTVATPARARWTAIGTADPANNIVGSGYLDLKEFQKRGLRVESIGDQLACYFEDGIAFLIPTGRYADPFRYQVVARHRGILSTFAVTSISSRLHFGIYDDGWWLLDSSGAFKEVGIFRAPESTDKVVELHKWVDRFYQLLDISLRHRIVVREELRRYIHISFPEAGVGGDYNTGYWIFDTYTDSVWPMTGIAVTQFWSVDRAIRVATTYGDLAGMSYGSLMGTKYGDWAGKFGLRAFAHFDHLGYVYGWDDTLDTRDGAAVSGYWRTHDLPVEEDEGQRETLQRIGLEYMNVNGPGCSLDGINEDGEVQTASVGLDEGPVNSMHTAYGHYRLNGSHHAIRLSFTAPFAIRSFRPTWQKDVGDEREG